MAEPATKFTLLVTALATTSIGGLAPTIAEVSVTLVCAVFGACLGLSRARKSEEWKGPWRHVGAGLGCALIGSPLASVFGAKLLGVQPFDALPLTAGIIGFVWRDILTLLPGLLDKWRK